jgi:hypothetical protein
VKELVDPIALAEGRITAKQVADYMEASDLDAVHALLLGVLSYLAVVAGVEPVEYAFAFQQAMVDTLRGDGDQR